jgi:hypothetical protein
LIVLFTTTSVPDFNDLFDVLKKQLFASQLQASISNSLIVPVDGSSLLTNNLKGASYVLEYAGKAYYTLCQRGAWDKCLQQAPGESAHINPNSDGPPSSDGSHFKLRCFNCGGRRGLGGRCWISEIYHWDGQTLYCFKACRMLLTRGMQ